MVLMVRGDDQSAGGCIYNGGNQTGGNCSGNTNNVNPKPSIAAALKVDFRLLALLYILLNLGFVLGDQTAGGCIYNGGDQQGSDCNNNTSSQSLAPVSSAAPVASSNSTQGLPPGALAGIAVAAVTAFINLMALAATLMDRGATVDGHTPVNAFKRAYLYRLVEGCTLGFGCGCFSGLEHWMGEFLERGDKWHWANERSGEAGTQTEMSMALNQA
jgi:hypothetical protein